MLQYRCESSITRVHHCVMCRVFGDKFAEMPFVATKEGYRREGNCKRLVKVRLISSTRDVLLLSTHVLSVVTDLLSVTTHVLLVSTRCY